MPKIILLLLVILATAVIETVVDKSLGVDLSGFSSLKRIVHGVVYRLTGAAIAATVWFI